jgi:hypothetical protein
MGHGMGATMAPMTAAVMNSVGPQRAGLGSAMTNTSREVGGVLGIALLGAILESKLRASFGPALAHLGLAPAKIQQVAEGVANGRPVGQVAAKLGLTNGVQTGVKSAYADAFMRGFHPALVFGGSVLLVAAFIANRYIPGRATVREAEAAGLVSHQPVSAPAG